MPISLTLLSKTSKNRTLPIPAHNPLLTYYLRKDGEECLSFTENINGRLQAKHLKPARQPLKLYSISTSHTSTILKAGD